MSDLQHQRIIELCQELRLSAMLNLYSGIAQSAAAKEASFADFLEETLRAERDARSARAREMFARVAGFPAIKALDGFDFGFAAGVPRPQIHELAGLSFIERAENVVFLGPSGVGKTHLAVAALKELIHCGHAGLFCDYRELLKEIQASYNPASESTEMKILEPIRTVEILVLDDLGASKPSDWVRDIVGIVLNARYNENRTTIITTNYLDNPATEGEAARLPNGKLIAPTREDALEQRIGSRMRSRLYEMCRTVEVSAPDFRREKTQAGHARA